MFNKQELEYLYTAVNMMPPPNSTEGGRAKAHMIAKLCNVIDEVDAAANQPEGDPAEAQEVAQIQERQKAKAGNK